MKKRGRRVTAKFILLQPEGAARSWHDDDIKKILDKLLGIWADGVDGQAKDIQITIDSSEPAA